MKDSRFVDTETKHAPAVVPPGTPAVNFDDGPAMIGAAETVRVPRYVSDGSGKLLGYDELVEGVNLQKRLWLVVKDDKGLTLRVFTIDSEWVNDELDVGFADGGSERSHDFIPAREIWLSMTDSERRRHFHLKHEMEERQKRRDGAAFEPAHHAGNEAESKARQEELGVKSPHVGDV
jgi:hypothetical protein